MNEIVYLIKIMMQTGESKFAWANCASNAAQLKSYPFGSYSVLALTNANRNLEAVRRGFSKFYGFVAVEPKARILPYFFYITLADGSVIFPLCQQPILFC